ncbi:Acyl-CoA dehydrogenase [Oceaniovalibus guishaninsula JLT2003]|uniref:Acyl-CoA dehydrogenase n=1 Tax=Oceaniovalibus guishaninsula JLT2003 TaxID=1231392 RepID=K2H903_9RHOB|nr:acyl-CoA dehydrogenase family protein [Oceaniovalibus guishaninsula]EKE43077.1 Acyl-CoA dehydrogenase [Oceaniovalibus guishaninsula JLT2003]
MMCDIEERLAALSPPGDEEPPIAPLIDALRQAGLLQACAPLGAGGRGPAHCPRDPEALVEALAAVGGGNLSAGRLFEGHVNAVKLIALYGDRGGWLAQAGQGRLFGVWGADGPDPVRIEGGVLRGQKLYASGAGVLDRAVVPVRDGDGQVQLVVLDTARLAGRLHPGEWHVSGMRATASGRCDLEGVAIGADDLLGAPGDYHREPHFQGGVWRYAAVQMGAMRAMTRAAAAQIAARGQADAPLQSARLRRMVVACETARLWLVNAARVVERSDAAPDDAATAMLARLTVADEAVALMNAMDEALGAASFATAHLVERRRRDLLFYLRQANPDGLAQTAMRMAGAGGARARRWHLA